MVLEERIASEAQRLKLKYFGDQSLKMAVPALVPQTYRGFLGEEALEAEEDFLLWEKENKVRRITPKDILQFYGVKNFKASGGSYFCASVTQRRLFDMNSAGRTWNDNIIWVKGNCPQRDDEELLDLRFRSTKQSVKSTMERKESLLDEVAEEVVCLVKGIWLGIEEQESEMKKAKSELEKNLARAKTDALQEVKQLKATHAAGIGQL
ncbi:hypothetical protein GIB67_034410 [Kingdonia uniflora]|uniref:Uncharacterized protein n=1 Tax=Kingdonia uniflora TaxID=39325 RepID=A0A7J7NSW9_9MAGN|nr:hypothetical protein GIB67_034410 [Kingdonia uniflora]